MQWFLYSNNVGDFYLSMPEGGTIVVGSPYLDYLRRFKCNWGQHKPRKEHVLLLPEEFVFNGELQK